jgi:hypothetical protein
VGAEVDEQLPIGDLPAVMVRGFLNSVAEHPTASEGDPRSFQGDDPIRHQLSSGLHSEPAIIPIYVPAVVR